MIESASLLASNHADTIKTHHNDSKLIRELRDKGRVIEPLQDFHKDEVSSIKHLQYTYHRTTSNFEYSMHFSYIILFLG